MAGRQAGRTRDQEEGRPVKFVVCRGEVDAERQAALMMPAAMALKI